MLAANSKNVLFAAALMIAGVLAIPSTSWAGCGCDHPPPPVTAVMPPFAPIHDTIRVWAQDDPFTVGDAYQAAVGGRSILGTVVATDPMYIEITVPPSASVGPADIRVYRTSGWGWFARTTFDLRYPNSEFTVLPKPVVLKDKLGIYRAKAANAAVTADGTVLMPIDLSKIHEAIQFAFQLESYPLAFEPQDITFYSKDGVDLTLFTLAVDDATKREWGSYYGWMVEDDRDLHGYRFEDKRARSWDMAKTSDILFYWRHEFHTYAAAHSAGGSHEVRNGFHPDGSLHIDHDRIVLAIRGKVRHWLFPSSDSLAKTPRAGKARVDFKAIVVPSEGPLEMNDLSDLLNSKSNGEPVQFRDDGWDD